MIRIGRPVLRPVAALAFFILAVCPASGDIVRLKDGSVRKGKIVEKTSEGVTLEVSVGNVRTKIFVPGADIASIEEKEEEPTAAELEIRKRKDAAEASKDAGALRSLARFLDTVPGYSADAEKTWEKLLAALPDDAEARKRLGFVRDRSGKWVREADAKKAAGLVKSGDEWVAPEERSLRIDRKESRTVGMLIGRSGEGAQVPSVRDMREEELKAAEREVALRNYNRLMFGESLLARLGYYDYGISPYYYRLYPPVYEGTYMSTGTGDIFVGRVGWPDLSCTPWPGWYGWSSGGLNTVGPIPLYFERGGWATVSGTGTVGISPGLIYRSGDNVFTFGTNFGGGWGSGGWGFSFSRDTGDTKIRIGLGGSSWSGGGWGGIILR
ncbi:MAG: hypothetical protein N3A38_11555 [Planctomycetota bacterium]|nr:hypothetical protein [Planctomycetota bacterium]